MNGLPEEIFITEEEYAVLEANAAVKHEYYQGRMYAMAGASGRHNDVQANAITALRIRLAGTSCRPRGSDQRVRVEATGLQTYPDVTVFCRESRFADSNELVLLDPRLIIEILSPSTEASDREEKLAHYQQVPALQHLLIVDPRRVLVDHWQRLEDGTWHSFRHYFRTDVLQLTDLSIELPLADLYLDVDVPDGLLVHPTWRQSLPDEI